LIKTGIRKHPFTGLPVFFQFSAGMGRFARRLISLFTGNIPVIRWNYMSGRYKTTDICHVIENKTTI
jgi:hypothetical protein